MRYEIVNYHAGHTLASQLEFLQERCQTLVHFMSTSDRLWLNMPSTLRAHNPCWAKLATCKTHHDCHTIKSVDIAVGTVD